MDIIKKRLALKDRKDMGYKVKEMWEHPLVRMG